MSSPVEFGAAPTEPGVPSTRARRVRAVTRPSLVLALACGPIACANGGDAGDVCAAELAADPYEDGARALVTRLETASGRWTSRVRIRAPAAPTPDPLPVAIVVAGAWRTDGTPVDEDLPTPAVGTELVALHPALLPDDEDDDRRGPLTRQAIARAVRYAAGLETDHGGCSLADRVGSVGDIVLVGVSNGGNAAIAALADTSLDLPSPVGTVTWETPAAPAFVTVSFGGDPTVYAEAACRGTNEPPFRVSCTYPADQLIGNRGAACFDVDGDAVCSAADVYANGVNDPVSGLQMMDPDLVELLEARDLRGVADAPSNDARAWWNERDASVLAAGAVANHPEVAYMLLASEEDHVLPWSDHPHVYALGEALQAAGAAWTRLNPDMDRIPDARSENAPNAPLRMNAPDAALLDEDAENPLDAVLTAAVLELAGR